MARIGVHTRLDYRPMPPQNVSPMSFVSWPDLIHKANYVPVDGKSTLSPYLSLVYSMKRLCVPFGKSDPQRISSFLKKMVLIYVERRVLVIVQLHHRQLEPRRSPVRTRVGPP